MEQTPKRYSLQIHQVDPGAPDPVYDTWTELTFASEETVRAAMREIDKAMAAERKAAFLTDDHGVIALIPGKTIHRAFAVPEGIEPEPQFRRDPPAPAVNPQAPAPPPIIPPNVEKAGTKGG